MELQTEVNPFAGKAKPTSLPMSRHLRNGWMVLRMLTLSSVPPSHAPKIYLLTLQNVARLLHQPKHAGIWDIALPVIRLAQLFAKLAPLQDLPVISTSLQQEKKQPIVAEVQNVLMPKTRVQLEQKNGAKTM